MQEAGFQSLRLAWDSAEPDWVLEGSGDLFEFSTLLTAPGLDGGEITVTVPVEQSPFFWRLRAQETSGIIGGRGFLRDSQGAFGNWSENGTANVFISSVSLQSLLDTDLEDPEVIDEVGNGLEVLRLTETRNNDELSRKIMALAAGGLPVDDLVDDLLMTQNVGSGGGWGAAVSYYDTLLDTSLALRALTEAGVPSGLSVVGEVIPVGLSSEDYVFEVPPGATSLLLSVRETTGNARFNLRKPSSAVSVYNASPGAGPTTVGFGTPEAGTWTLTVDNNAGSEITYAVEVYFTTAEGLLVSRLSSAASLLANSRNPDGGWPIFAGSDSHLLSTYEVMTTLDGYGDGFGELLEGGANWLYNTLRNPDGGYSSEPGISNPLETALAILAIRAAGSGLDLSGATAFLESQQLLNGSWENDPYLTAMAIRALFVPPESPVVSSISNEIVEDPNLFAVINLDNYVNDPDTAAEDITWTVTGETQLTVSVVNRVATITYPAGTALSETLTFTATDPDGLSDATTATFTVTVAPLFDYSISRGGSVVDNTRTFSTTPANFNVVRDFLSSIIGLPADITFATAMATWAPDTFQPQYTITVGPAAPLGIHKFSVEYVIRQEDGTILSPVFDNIFDITIEITP